MENDTVIISGLELSIRIGTSQEERALPQRMDFDLELSVPRWTERNRAGDLSATVCYSTAAAELNKIVSNGQWALVEELCVSMLKHLFVRFPALQSATIVARKFVVPHTRSTGLRMSRKRGDF